MSEQADAIITEDDAIITVTFDRPKKLNAINTQMSAALWEATNALADRDDLRCMVITGKGPYFTAGIDLLTTVGNRPGNPETEHLHPGWNFRRNYRSHHLLYDEFEAVEKPIILAAQGHCLGAGLENGWPWRAREWAAPKRTRSVSCTTCSSLRHSSRTSTRSAATSSLFRQKYWASPSSRWTCTPMSMTARRSVTSTGCWLRALWTRPNTPSAPHGSVRPNPTREPLSQRGVRTGLVDPQFGHGDSSPCLVSPPPPDGPSFGS